MLYYNQMIKEKEKFEVLLENIRGDIKGVAEGQSVLQRQADKLSQDVNALDKKMDTIHFSLKNEIKITGLALKEEIQAVDRKLDEHIRQPHIV